MNKHQTRRPEMPTIDQLQTELRRTRYHQRFAATVRRILMTLVLIVLTAMAVSYCFVSVMRIHSDAMAPTLKSGDMVVALKNSDYVPGDVIAYYYNDKLLVKRVIAVEGDSVQIAEDGSVTVNGALLNEPYVSASAKGQCDIEMPYTVPRDRVFVLGDNREGSLDSRSTAMGCIAREQIVGRVVLRVWPVQEWKVLSSGTE